MKPHAMTNRSVRIAAGPKYRALAALIEALTPACSDGALALDARWRDNEEALGLYAPECPELTAFVFTYAQPRDCYAVEFDYPDALAAAAAGMVRSHEALELDALLAMLATHFDLPELA